MVERGELVPVLAERRVTIYDRAEVEELAKHYRPRPVGRPRASAT